MAAASGSACAGLEPAAGPGRHRAWRRRPPPGRRPTRRPAGAGRRRGRRSSRRTRWPPGCGRAACRAGRAAAARGRPPRRRPSARRRARRPRATAARRRPTPISPLTQISSPGRAPARESTRRRRTVPMAVTSTISGPGDRVMLPPMSATPWAAASAMNPSTIGLEVGERQRRRQRERQQGRAGRRAHGRQVAQVHRQRAMADRARRRERAVEVDALDQGVGGEHLEQVPRRLDDRGIVAEADGDPGGRRRHARAHARDEGVLADVGDATWRTQRRASRGSP